MQPDADSPDGARVTRLRLWGSCAWPQRLGIHFVDISHLPLRINALTLRHIFVNPQTLLSHVTRHLTMQVQSSLFSSDPPSAESIALHTRQTLTAQSLLALLTATTSFCAVYLHNT